MDAGSINGHVQTQLNANQFSATDSLVLITEKLVQQVTADRVRDTKSVDTDSKWLEAHREKSRLTSFKARIADNLGALTKATMAIDWTEKYLTDMKTTLQSLSSSSTAEERATAAASFDENRTLLNSRVNGANQQVGFQSINLVGNATGPDWKTDDVYSPTSLSGGFTAVEGEYIGTEFVIEDADGDYWRLNSGENKFVEYNTSGAATGGEVSTEGLTVDSYDSSTGAITYGGSGALTGTLVRGGLEVLSSDYYNGFADDAAVAEALADVDAAITSLSQKTAYMEAQATLIEANDNTVSSQILRLDKEIFERVKLNIDENAAIRKAADVKIGIVVNNLNLTSAANTALIENMLSLTQGQQSAGGIFGLMGY